MIESVTAIGVSLCMEMPSKTGYQEPPELLVIPELSITILPVWSLETKKMAEPCSFTSFYSIRVHRTVSVIVFPSLYIAPPLPPPGVPGSDGLAPYPMVGVGHIFQIRLGRDWRGPTRITGRRTALRVNWREGDDLVGRNLRFAAISTTAEWNDRKRCNAEHEK